MGPMGTLTHKGVSGDQKWRSWETVGLDTRLINKDGESRLSRKAPFNSFGEGQRMKGGVLCLGKPEFLVFLEA